MKINIVACGVIKNAHLENLMYYYTKQLKQFSVNIIQINVKNLNNNQANAKVLQTLDSFNQSYNILLDENGKQLTSLQFANSLQSLTNYKNINFAIGPNDGFNQQAKQYANLLLGLSKFTFPHKLARLMLIEQIYRAESIINNLPYHKQ